jgi:hypothetical protein
MAVITVRLATGQSLEESFCAHFHSSLHALPARKRLETKA